MAPQSSAVNQGGGSSGPRTSGDARATQWRQKKSDEVSETVGRVALGHQGVEFGVHCSRVVPVVLDPSIH